MFQSMNRLLSRMLRRGGASTRRRLRNRELRKNRALFRECLESRSQMAADISVVGGVLTINADPAGTNAIVVDTNPASNSAYFSVHTTSPNGDNNKLVSKNGIISIRFNGSDQADQISNVSSYRLVAYGYGGSDTFNGGSGNDTLWGQNGEDVLRGGAGNDLLYGGNDNDVLEGLAGNDTLYGHDGNDHLFGGQGDDQMYGGAGMDGLFGDAGLDTYNGGSGADRMLNDPNEGHQFFADFGSQDVQINFLPAPYDSFVINGTLTNWGAGEWSSQDILKVDKALEAIARRTGSNVMLVDVDGAELSFFRHSVYSDDNPSVQYTAFNRGGDMYFSNSVFASENNAFRTVVHEIAHNWDSASEIDVRLPGQGSAIIGGFRSISDWKSGQFFGNHIPGYEVSLDGDWSFKSSATFARNYGKTNPYEDFATVMEEYFLDYDDRPGADLDEIPLKWFSQNTFLNQLAGIEFSNSQIVGMRDEQGALLVPGRSQLVPAEGAELTEAPAPQAIVNPLPVMNKVGGTVTVQGTALNDQVLIQYVFGPHGHVSANPTPWVRISANNANGAVIGEFPTAQVQLVSFSGYAGNDSLQNQTLLTTQAFGGTENDNFHGGGGVDRFSGGDGNDVLNGSGGNDVLSGGSGDDQILGGTGADYLAGGTGVDTMFGGAGDDHLIGDDGNDELNGDADNDILEGRDGNDALSGGEGRDLLIGGLGSDVLQGGNGDDILIGDQIAFDNNHDALSHLWTEWTSAHDYVSRVQNITGMQHANFDLRLNKDFFLKRGATIISDGAVDTLLGQGNRDVFFTELGVDVTDRLLVEAELT